MSFPPSVASRHGSRARQVAVAVAVGAVLVGAGLFVVFGLSPTPSEGGGASAPIFSANVTGVSGPIVNLSQGFLGVNVRATATYDASDDAALNATSARLLRWPGGGLGDRVDPLADGGVGLVHNDNGTTDPVDESLAQFASWCRENGLQSIVTLPGEIDDPAYAASITHFAVATLGFQPTYWEIGNEPARWTHYGVAWDNWTDSQNLTPTAPEYATLVAHYVTAIRSADPTARIVGLGGVGTGAHAEATWIGDSVALNGPNLSAVAIHVYPAGSVPQPRSLASWFSSLSGAASLAARVPGDEAAIASACATCSISLLADEFGSGTDLTPSSSLSGGALATFVSAEIVQAVALPVASLDFWDFEGSTPEAWFASPGVASPVYTLYSALASRLGDRVQTLTLTAGAPGLEGLESENSSGNVVSLWLVDASATDAFSLNLTSTFGLASDTSAWWWNSSSPQPSNAPLRASGASHLVLPPASLVILSGLVHPHVGPQGPNVARVPLDTPLRDGSEPARYRPEPGRST